MNRIDGASLDELLFLTPEDVIAIHSDVIDATTPGEPKAVLDYGRLEAAVMTPQQAFGGEYFFPSVFQMAAAYLRGLACDHAFQQGNKRVAWMAMYVFLRVNGILLEMTEPQALAVTLAVIAHQLDIETVADLLREHSTFGPD